MLFSLQSSWEIWILSSTRYKLTSSQGNALNDSATAAVAFATLNSALVAAVAAAVAFAAAASAAAASANVAFAVASAILLKCHISTHNRLIIR